MTLLRDRLQTLIEHGDYDPLLAGAVLGISPQDVNSLLENPNFEPVVQLTGLRRVTYSFTYDTPGLNEGVLIPGALFAGDYPLSSAMSISVPWGPGSVTAVASLYSGSDTVALGNESDYFQPTGENLSNADHPAASGTSLTKLADGEAYPNVSDVVTEDGLYLVVSADGSRGGAAVAATSGAAKIIALVLPAA